MGIGYPNLNLQEAILKQYYLYNKIPLYFKDLLTCYLYNKLPDVIYDVEITIPESLIKNVSSIHISEHQIFKTHNISSYFEKNCIFITKEVIDERELFVSIVYELSHAIEDFFNMMLYTDGKIEQEFVLRKLDLYKRLPIKFKNKIKIENYLNSNYQLELYSLLYKEIGPELLAVYSEGLFAHHNMIHSIKEYFSLTFYMNSLFLKIEELKSINPVVYNKAANLYKFGKEQLNEKRNSNF